jgi:hypothetical protein
MGGIYEVNVEMGSSAKICILTHRQHGDLIILLSLFEESRLRRVTYSYNPPRINKRFVVILWHNKLLCKTVLL